MAQDFFSGKTAVYGINGTNYEGNDGWSIEDTPTEIRTDNTAGGGASDRIVASHDLVATIEQSWDASANPFDEPPGLYPGAELTELRLYLHGTTSPYYRLPRAIVLGAPVENKVGSVCKITFKIGNKGTFSRPTGNFEPDNTLTPPEA